MRPIDVVIPAHSKDRAVLPSAIRSVLRHVSPLGRVFVVSRRPGRWRGGRVESIPEPPRSCLPTLEDVRAYVHARLPAATGRSEWLYQQLLKLGAPGYIDGLTSPYLVVDADVIFLRAVSFELPSGKLFPYSVATEYNEPYLDAYARLMGGRPSSQHSLVAHHMLFERELISELLAEIERRCGKPWHEAYLDAVDLAEPSSISEWNTYGWWLLERHPDLCFRRQLTWLTVPAVPRLVGRARYASDYDFVAAHAWARQPTTVRLRGGLRRLKFEARAAAAARLPGDR
ncbi:MAG: DUF6492 family protein [Solirubrobacteraceae bacterium]